MRSSEWLGLWLVQVTALLVTFIIGIKIQDTVDLRQFGPKTLWTLLNSDLRHFGRSEVSHFYLPLEYFQIMCSVHTSSMCNYAKNN